MCFGFILCVLWLKKAFATERTDENSEPLVKNALPQNSPKEDTEKNNFLDNLFQFSAYALSAINIARAFGWTTLAP